MSHTPGPWHAGAGDWLISQSTGMGYRNFPIRGGEGFDIAMVYCDEDDAEQAANVSLIAAAPELLDCCRKLLEIVEDEFANDKYPEELGSWQRVMADSNRAIAKAEGRTDDQ